MADYNDTVDKVSRGYLPREVEDHYPTNSGRCEYQPVSEPGTRYSGCKGGVTIPNERWTRYCRCQAKLPQREELHYKKACKWKRVRDEENGKVYLYRRCLCYKPKIK
ncbi:uncharacterized protein [Watersipora subatra]|uniref:uncharacterized protein n=1 Tax=Watersipora subatra TaxID=2589382 RepID=UPI00355C42B6